MGAYRRYMTYSTESEWGGNQQQLATFSTIEEFWGIYGRLLPVSELPENGNYHFFKVNGLKGIYRLDRN